MLIFAVQQSDLIIKYIYIIFHILFHYGLSQDIEYRSLCFMDFPGGSVGKDSAYNAGYTGEAGSIPWGGEIPWRKAWQPTPVFLPGKSHGQRNLTGYSLWGRKRIEQDWESEHITHCAIQRTLFICSLCNSLHLLTPNSDPSLPLSLANHKSALCVCESISE